MNDEMTVKGYLFGTAADAELAKEELEKIEYLDKNMNYNNTAKVLQLYDKALDSKMFKTPIGWDYLNKLKRILIDAGYLEIELRPIPLYSVFSRADEGTTLTQRIKPAPKKISPYKRKYIIAVMISVVMVITVFIMFLIAVQSETPNMINYRNAIVNEYASWEQDIKTREDAVRAKERELGIASPLPHEQQIEALDRIKDDSEGEK